MPIFADSLYGITIAADLGLGLLWDGPPADLASHLAAEAAANGNAYGLRVLTGRDDAEPFPGIDRTQWGMAAPTWGVVALLAGAAPAAALDFPQRFLDNARVRLGDQWSLAGLYTGTNWTGVSPLDDGSPWCTNHYGMALTHYYLHHALSGQQTDVVAGRLTFAPKLACPYVLPVLLAGTTGSLACDAGGRFNVSLAFGRLALPAGGLAVGGSAYPGAVDIGPGGSVAWG